MPARRTLLLASAALTLALTGTSGLALAAPQQAPAPGALMLRQAVADLPTAVEDRAGYKRTAFRHWVDADHDGCNTRAEVLIEEAVTAPTIEPGCKVTGGAWLSYYDNVVVEGPAGLDIDHLVPLAEAWDSGASTWSPQQREAYANFLDRPEHLVAVTARTNRQKADQDPSTWLPPYQDARCRYITEWTAVKRQWALTVDAAEKQALTTLAQDCPDVPLPDTTTEP